MPLVKKKISEIFSARYGQDNVCCEPSPEEIKRAVLEKDVDKREFQKDLPELLAEWEQVSGPERYSHIRKYHARRTAFFVLNRWDNYPIVLKQDSHKLAEGSHRLRAAIQKRGRPT